MIYILFAIGAMHKRCINLLRNETLMRDEGNRLHGLKGERYRAIPRNL
jgi:hypothetical protein